MRNPGCKTLPVLTFHDLFSIIVQDCHDHLQILLFIQWTWSLHFLKNEIHGNIQALTRSPFHFPGLFYMQDTFYLESSREKLNIISSIEKIWGARIGELSKQWKNLFLIQFLVLYIFCSCKTCVKVNYCWIYKQNMYIRILQALQCNTNDIYGLT